MTGLLRVCLWHSTKLLSAWLTVVITMERLLAVAMPLKVGRLSTPFRMRLVVAALAGLCTALRSDQRQPSPTP